MRYDVYLLVESARNQSLALLQMLLAFYCVELTGIICLPRLVTFLMERSIFSFLAPGDQCIVVLLRHATSGC